MQPKDKQRLDEALARLAARHQFGIKLGLDSVRRLCALVGNPQDHFAVVHVAGTNGKGSVCAVIESVLRSAGLSVGLYTSPHLVRFHERIRMNGVDVSDEALLEALAVCEKAAEQVLQEQSHEITFFEMMTAIAFVCFQRAGIQIAVVETGLGGRLDATNIVVPLISVITRIAKDHVAYLGDSLEAIAGEKAGIIKRGRPVVAGPQEDAVELVLRRVAAACGAPFALAVASASVSRVEGNLKGQKVHCDTDGGWSGTAWMPLAGGHQLENLGIALAVLEQVFEILRAEVPFSVVKSGLAGLRWRGRFEVLCEDPLVLADAAHNPSGAETLVDTLKANKLSRVALVTGMCGDKDVGGVVTLLAGIARRVWAVPLSNSRLISPQRLAELFRGAGVEAEAGDALETALTAAESWAKAEGTAVVVTGSIFLLGDVLPLYANRMNGP